MPDNLDSRVSSLEEQQRHVWAVLDSIALKQEKLDDLLDRIAQAQFENELRFRETDERIRGEREETQRRFREMDEHAQQRGRALDERIDKLVSAIGEMLRRDSQKS
jgi:hypothetical protein